MDSVENSLYYNHSIANSMAIVVLFDSMVKLVVLVDSMVKLEGPNRVVGLYSRSNVTTKKTSILTSQNEYSQQY